ncbi:uncharacterized protein Z518_11258 [Rhinocladiella mackenziei CBS 650.93]|uniref:C2H2-type domain-containing protein n=1 Tax=Rhinocladiella mackenziei CBS 650.93 TaxID=1442369 RepID=A0A0D2IS45_9EURO|nr:uncharacterized protein Z518_11258 [Rhinocladiella mackenziei CBS 650.93]KIW99519.1 hypothetical protein Z518_11258 [Rhinocladiella mackenziei CBS 650.93]
MARNSTGSQDQKDRSYICRYCSKAFIRAEHLHRHLSSHENKKPHGCSACGSSFGRADVLQRHKKKCSAHQRLVTSSQEAVAERENQQPQDRAGNDAFSGTGSESGHSLWGAPAASDSIMISPTSLTSLAEATNNRSTPALNMSSSTLSGPIVSNQTNGNTVLPTPPVSSSFTQRSDELGHSLSNDLSQAASWRSTTRDMYNLDFADWNTGDLTFLEDSLLPNFQYDATELVPPFQPSLDMISDNQSSPQPRGILLGLTRRVTPSPEDGGAQSSRQGENATTRGLRLCQEDINSFKKNMSNIHQRFLLSDFKVPSRLRMIRLLCAYFEYFDPHTPIVHRATFEIQSSHPALILAMLAIGGLHVSEHDFVIKAYDACCILLYNIEGHEVGSVRTPDIGIVQALLLCAQFGGFSDNASYFRRAEKHLTSAYSLLREYIDIAKPQQRRSTADWASWIASETCSRHERLLLRLQDELDTDLIAKIEKCLGSWELSWRRHPQAPGVPCKSGDPLLVDCLALLGSAYYHLYLGAELRALKTFAQSNGQLSSLPRYRSRDLTLKAVQYAAHSWFVRANLGIAHLQKTAALEFGAHSLVTAYEGGNVVPQ